MWNIHSVRSPAHGILISRAIGTPYASGPSRMSASNTRSSRSFRGCFRISSIILNKSDPVNWTSYDLICPVGNRSSFMILRSCLAVAVSGRNTLSFPNGENQFNIRRRKRLFNNAHFGL